MHNNPIDDRNRTGIHLSCLIAFHGIKMDQVYLVQKHIYPNRVFYGTQIDENNTTIAYIECPPNCFILVD
jgi:hypothetical protein